MKKPFKDPAAIKSQKPHFEPLDSKPYPFGWDFRSPPYDQRSSCFVNAGTYYGQGINQPVGHKGNPKSAESILPSGTKGFNEEPKYKST